MEDTVLFTKHAAPAYSAYLVRVNTGLKRVFLKGGSRVHTKHVPAQVHAQLVAQLNATNTHHLEGGAGAVAAAAHLPSAVVAAARKTPDPTTRISASSKRIMVKRPSELGPASAADDTNGYDYMECEESVEGPFAQPAPKHSRCEISKRDFNDFVAALTSRKNKLRLEGATLCDKMSVVLDRLEKSMKIVRFLGAGANGMTFLAVDKNDREFAVKLVVEKSKHKTDEFSNEVESQRLFSALGLAPQIHQSISLRLGDKVVHVLVMDRVHITVGELLCYQRLSVNSLQSLAVSIAKLIWKMHKAGFTHGDMHPENIMLRYDKATGKFKPLLIDFGYATAKFNDPLVDASLFVRDLKQMGVPKELVSYMGSVMNEVVSAMVHKRTTVAATGQEMKELVRKYKERRKRRQ